MGQKLSVKERALRLLAARSRSRSELKWRLVRAGFDVEEIDVALADLERVGLIDDPAFARDLATREVLRKGAGNRAALAKLRRSGVDAQLAERTLEEVAGDDEESRAETAARARMSRLGGLDQAVAYRRLLGYLQRRGYDGETARVASRRAIEGA